MVSTFTQLILLAIREMIVPISIFLITGIFTGSWVVLVIPLFIVLSYICGYAKAMCN